MEGGKLVMQTGEAGEAGGGEVQATDDGEQGREVFGVLAKLGQAMQVEANDGDFVLHAFLDIAQVEVFGPGALGVKTVSLGIPVTRLGTAAALRWGHGSSNQ